MAQKRCWQSIPVTFGFLTILTILTHLDAAELNFEREIQPLLTKYCVGCHNAEEAEGGFACHDYDGLMKGSKERRVIQAGSADQSHLMKLMLGIEEPRMPPEDEAQPTPDELKRIGDWIALGAHRGEHPLSLRDRLKVAAVTLKHDKEPSITAMHLLEDDQLIALGRYGEVSLYKLTTLETLKRWNGIVGKVTTLRPSVNGQKIVIGSGVPGVGGQISVLDVQAQEIVQQLEGHRDTIYSAVISPDGSMIASGGYDRRILLWDTASGTILRHFDGHNGPVYDLDFHPSGKLLASASGDETIKIWDVDSGRRLDTLSQGEAEQYSVRFTPDGNRVVAAGADRRVRVWRLVSRDREAINPMLFSCFAHEKAIVALRISPDRKILMTTSEDRTVKLWTTDDLTPIGEVGRVEDTPSDAAWSSDSKGVTVATLNGRVESFPVEALIEAFYQRSDRELKQSGRLATVDVQHSMKPDEPTAVNSSPGSVDEIEPNNSIDSAMLISVPGEISGKVFSDNTPLADEDWFCFDAQAGEKWVITASAATSDSPLDSSIEVRDAEGRLVLRTRLQAVRESYFTFRGKDSSNSDDFRLHRWEDMELNELLFSGGEVVKLWLYPRGPDSGFKVYPGSGKRQTYFDTTANSHALGEPAWIVRELAATEEPIPNGLPTFPIFFENDDDSTRQNGKNSRLIFTAPQDGRFFVRLRDARQLQGDAFAYKFEVRRQMMDFAVSTTTKSLDIAPGSGGEFSINVKRFDDFNGPIDLRVEGLPDGIIVSQPLNIEADQISALGTLFIPQDSTDIPDQFSLTIHAFAEVDGQSIERVVPTTIPISLSKKPSIRARFSKSHESEDEEITELVIRPGETISTFVVVERGTEMGDIPFGKDDSGRNLPHGIFVSNIGLSGLVVKPGENSREVFITAAPWVASQTRPFHLKSTLKGTPTTKPILLRVEAP